MTADAAHVAAVAEAMQRWATSDDRRSRAEVAVETVTPLIRAQVAATCAPIIRAFIVEEVGWDAGVWMTLQADDLAARIARGGA